MQSSIDGLSHVDCIADLSQYVLEVLRRDEEFVLYRGEHSNQHSPSVLLLAPASMQPALETVKKIEHEYSLRDELDSAWAVRPLALSEHLGRTTLVLEDLGGETLDRLLPGPMEIPQFLRLAVGLATALGGLHKRELIHKDVRPTNVLANSATGQVRLMGFGIASRLPRERQAPEPPEFIVGTLPYMAPEQTGRMNRSIDSRSDLYALGVTLYEMVTGSLPFTASDPMELVHCHIARQPTPPCLKLKGIPDPLSAIIMKLLAKTAEERYQTAVGVESDLRRCLAEWERQHRIDEFSLGEQDTPDRLLIPEKLYGREIEIDTLLAAFNRIVAGGRPELVLVSGYSGIGKSSVVNELHKRLVPPRGLFASGKFDQYKRDIPYATLVQAFQSLLRSLLTESEADLSKWRDALRQALDTNGQLMVDLVPELRLIIGDQPPVPELPPQDARRRFHMVFRRFISVFARPEHPLALFLDDLQWLDAATLDLIEDLLNGPDVSHLMLIGAYRNNEVDSAHPLMRKLCAIRQTGSILHDIVLAPLARKDLEQLIGDTLHCEPDRANPLAHLVQDKTGGNPFFAIRFIASLADDGLLAFDHGEGRWSWDLNRIRAMGYTDNVVDLMVGKLRRLRQQTQSALQQLSCLGHAADIAMLSQLFGTSEEQVHADLWEAVRLELIRRAAGSYQFVHDRVQEAAYSLIPERLRPEAHLRLGRLLLAHTSPAEREEASFEIVNQLNRGAELISSREEREQLAELNLIAGQRAMASTAYASAPTYLAAGAALLAEDCWERRHELAFALELDRAECEYVTAQLGAAEERLSALATRATTLVERAAVARLRMDLYVMLDQTDRAIAVGLGYLRDLGAEWSPHPSEEEARREYDRIWAQLGTRAIEDLIELPILRDPESLATLDILTQLLPYAMVTDSNLHVLVSSRAANLSLELGNCDASCVAYQFLAVVAGARFGNYQAGYRFGRLGYDLAEQRGWKRVQPRTSSFFGGLVLPWARPLKSSRDLLRRGFAVGMNIGDVMTAAASCLYLNANMLLAGDPLIEVEHEAERNLEFAQKASFGMFVDLIAAPLGLVRTLRGLTRKFGSFDGEQFEELLAERRFASNPNLQIAECWYWIRKLQARFLAGDVAAAVDASRNAERLLWTSRSQLEAAEYHFYSALSRAACCDSVSAEERQQHLETLALHQRQLDIWAQNCPENFENRAALVGAEVARIEGRLLDAEQLYEKAIVSASANGFVNNEAIANELAAQFYAARGFEKIARAYLCDARYCYQRWGADGKVRQLDELFPQLSEEKQPARGAGTIGAPVEHLDLRTVIKVSQAVSAEMDVDKLIDTVMRAAIEHAGATRGLLILSRRDGQQMEAEAKTIGDKVLVQRKEAALGALPQSIINYVVRTQEFVILDDASTQNRFGADTYFSEHQARSVLCLPLTTQGKLVGLLYLENNLAARVFTHSRIAILKVLASQAAISLESSRLYSELRDREAKIRRLVDANIIGICIWNIEGDIIDANDAFLEMLGYDRNLFRSAPMRWTEMTPPEWRENDARMLAELQLKGTSSLIEKEFFRKDGSRVPILGGAALFEAGGTEGVGFILDLSEQKRAEAEIRTLKDQLYRENVALTEAQKLSHTGSWAWNVSDRSMVHLSEEWYRVCGYNPAEGVPVWEKQVERVHPEDRLKWVSTIERAIVEKTDYDQEFRIALPNGIVKWIHTVGHPVLSVAGDLEQFVGSSTDITERKSAEQEREKLRQLEADLAHIDRVSKLGEMAASLAHEIKQPIAAAITSANSCIEWLAHEPPNLDRARTAAARIDKYGNRAAEIIDRIRSLYKKSPPQRELVDVNETIHEMLTLLNGEATRYSVAMGMKLAAELPKITADRVQFQQVLMNLMLNAIEAMKDSGGELTVKSELQGGQLHFSVSDTGVGLPTEGLDQMFSAFFTTKPQGSGMGLAISRSIVESHGGQLWATANDGRGAIFHFTLPHMTETSSQVNLATL